MTSEEIQQSRKKRGGARSRRISPGFWCREIAYQLAKQTELQSEVLVCSKRTIQIQEAVYADRLATPQPGKSGTVGERGEYPIAEFDDGSRVKLSEWTVAEHPAGDWGEVVLRFCHPAHRDRYRRYRALDLEPGKRDAVGERGEIAELIESRVNLERCEADDRCDYDHVCRIHKIASLLKQQHSRVSEPSVETSSTTQKEICKPGEHDFGAIPVPGLETLCIKCGLSIREISENRQEC